MQVQEGQGWRLLVDPARCPFAVLIGGEGWAAELTQAEARLLALGVERLVNQHATLVDQLLAEEAITLEWESGELWLALEGDRQAWQLRFVLTPASGQRALEGAWAPTASRAVAAALRAVRSSLSDPA
jgi:hypothetical protein